MPVYEYRCEGCGRKATLLHGLNPAPEELTCPACGSRELKKLISRFRMGRDEDARIDEIADRLEAMGEPESPSAMRAMMREMGSALDEGIPDELEEIFEEEVAPGLDETDNDD